MIQIIPWSTPQTLNGTSASTYFHDIIGGAQQSASTTEAAFKVPIASAGTFRNLDVRIATAPGAGKSFTLTLRVNGVNTALTGAISDASTSLRVTGINVTVAAGDRISLQQTSAGSPVSTAWEGSIEFDSSAANVSVHGGQGFFSIPSGATRYEGAFRAGASFLLTVANDAKNVVAVPGDITALYAMRSGTPTASQGTTCYINLNGVRQDGGGGTVNTAITTIGTTGEGASSVSFTLPVVVGDVVYLEVVCAAGGSGGVWQSFGLRFTATTDDTYNLTGYRATRAATDAETWFAVPQASATNQTSDASYGAGFKLGPTSIQVSTVQLLLSAAPGVGKTRSIVLRKNAADTALLATATDTAVTASVTSTVSFVDTDRLAVRTYGTGSPTSTTLTWTFGVGVAAVIPSTVPEGDGENPGGTNPAAGTIPSTLPLKFVQIRTHDGTSRYFGETLLSDNTSWTAAPGKKPAKLVGVSKIRRTLSNRGAFVTTRFTVTLADTDRQFRVLTDATMLRGAYLAVYVIDDATRRAEGTPIRLMAGIVTSHRALPGFRYEITAEDVLGHKLSEYSKQPTLPPDKFSLTEFPGLDPSLEGRTIPIAMGALVDDVTENPQQGVVPALFVGYANLNTIGGVNAVVDCYIFTQCAAASVWNMYFNPPVWDESTPVEIGDVVRPTPDNASGFIYRATVAGTTGTTEPTWPMGVGSTVGDGSATWRRGEADSPDLRFLVPDAAYGTVLVTPGKPGWAAATSQTTNYLDYNGRRYTPLFILRSHRYAKAVREGRIIVTANLYGVTETSDGSGRYMDDPPRMWEWLLINYVFGRYSTGAYLTPPTLDGTYAVIDHTSVEAAVTAHDARYLPTGYVGAVLLGADGSQSTVFDELQKLCEGGDFDQGINRHGQLMVSVETVTASPVLTFDSQGDIEDGQYETWIETSDYANEQEHLWGRRYIQTSVVATPKQGDPLPRAEQRYGEWASGLTKQEDTVAIAQVGERIRYTLNNYAVRDDNVAESVGETLFLRNLGALREGPRMVRFTTGWQGLGTGSTYIDLGTVIGVTHPERVGSSATATDTCRVLAIEVDPLRDRVTLECRVIASIPDASLLQQWAPVMTQDSAAASDGVVNDGGGGGELLA